MPQAMRLAEKISMLLFAILLGFATKAAAATAYSSNFTLPADLGPYRVDISTVELVDYGRQDPYAPTPQFRRLMVSVYAPVPSDAHCTANSTIPYMIPPVAAYEVAALASKGVMAPNGTLSRPQLPVCRNDSSPGYAYRCTERFPLVIFSPGLGITRLYYGAIVEAVASAGFTVIAVDHTYDADIVVFPDGNIVHGTVSDDTVAEIVQALAVRTADIRFVLNRALAPGVLTALPPLDSEKAAIFGHSLGGATAAQVLHDDARFLGGLNLDGGYWGPEVKQGVSRPFLMFGAEGHNQSSDASWADFWAHSHGWKEQLTLLNATHGTFEDLPLLAEELGIAQTLPPGTLAPLIGTIEGHRALRIIFAYTTAFLRFAFGGGKEALLEGPSLAFPEVIFSNFSVLV